MIIRNKEYSLKHFLYIRDWMLNILNLIVQLFKSFIRFYKDELFKKYVCLLFLKY